MAYKKGRDHLIWTDDPYYLDLNDWDIDELIEINDWDPADYESEESRWDLVYDLNNDYLEDERANLDVNVGSTIYAIADVGRWNGRADGYKEIKSGNLSDCLYANVNGMSYCTWYVTQDGEFCLDESHHDGTNYVVYRAERNDLTDDEYNNLHYEAVTTEQLWDYTRPLGPDVGKVYGWTFNVSSSSMLRRNDKIEAADDQIEVPNTKTVGKVGSYDIIIDGYGFGIDNGTTVNRFIIDNDGKVIFDYLPPVKVKQKIYQLIRQGVFDNPNYDEGGPTVGHTLRYHYPGKPINADDKIDNVSIDFDIDAIRENHKKNIERSAWSRGVHQYADELLDELAEHIEGGYINPTDWKSYKDFEKALLNGAGDWNQYSWGGSGLIYDGDIAERLCSPSELKKTRNGERRPNSREEWLDVQARALYQAYRALLRAGVSDYIDQNKKRG